MSQCKACNCNPPLKMCADRCAVMQVVTTCAPPPSFAEPKTAAAKQAPCQQAADQAADFTWLGIKLKSSQTPERQAQRTQQVCNASASELQPEMKPARIAILYHRRVHASAHPM